MHESSNDLTRENLVIEMGQSLSLTKIYISVPSSTPRGIEFAYWRYIRREGGWSGQVVPPFSAWEIQHGIV
jgi:hypothetical protein